MQLTAAPKHCLQPVPLRVHEPFVEAVLLSHGLGEREFGEKVGHVVAAAG